MLTRLTAKTALCFLASLAALPNSAQGGPLLDWLFGRRQPAAYPVGQPVPLGYGNSGYAPYQAGYGGYPYNNGVYQTGYRGFQPAYSAPGYGNGAAGLVLPPAQTSVSYVPNFRTNYYRAPVTYYRPVLTTDPATGAQRVTMSPCTSFEYQTQRRPALGRSALFGGFPTVAAVPQPVQSPTYTLPQGGIPLAMQQRTVTAAYPPVYGMPANQGVVHAGAYQTRQLGTTPYYGTTNGGSCGGSQIVPGLTSPPAPVATPGVSPIYPQPRFVPSTPVQPLPGSNNQPPPSTGTDPADARPSLSHATPQTPPRSQLRAFTRAPASSGSAVSRQRAAPELRPADNGPAPISAPSDFDPGRSWTPDLLREQDLTARRGGADVAALAGQSKKIRWASFKSSPVADEFRSQPASIALPQTPAAAGANGLVALPPATAGQPVRQQEPRSVRHPSLRAQFPATAGQQLSPLPVAARPSPPAHHVSRPSVPPANKSQSRYQTGGWTRSR